MGIVSQILLTLFFCNLYLIPMSGALDTPLSHLFGTTVNETHRIERLIVRRSILIGIGLMFENWWLLRKVLLGILWNLWRFVLHIKITIL